MGQKQKKAYLKWALGPYFQVADVPEDKMLNALEYFYARENIRTYVRH